MTLADRQVKEMVAELLLAIFQYSIVEMAVTELSIVVPTLLAAVLK